MIPLILIKFYRKWVISALLYSYLLYGIYPIMSNLQIPQSIVS